MRIVGQEPRLPHTKSAGVDAKARLADNGAYGFFAALNDLVITGPTRTNTNDFRAILIAERFHTG